MDPTLSELIIQGGLKAYDLRHHVINLNSLHEAIQINCR